MEVRDTAVLEAVKKAQKSQFKLTAVKCELEIVFNKHETARREDDCSSCEDTGGYTCDYCDGRGDFSCEDCDGDGSRLCDQCDGEGSYHDDLGNEIECDCDDGYVHCDNACENGYIECDNCNDGYVGCYDCDREPRVNDEGVMIRHAYRQTRGPNWRDNRVIHDAILKQLVRYGLAKKMTQREKQNNDYRTYDYKPIGPLVFSKVYDDGTVDTEYTFTLLLDKPENTLLLPKIVKAFYNLRKKIGQPTDTSNAGMHMSLMNSEGGYYPVDPSRLDMARFDNFRRSMILLMPALFFLASPDSKSRAMGYRQPGASYDDKYRAIAYRGGALEFRVFETCYERPEAILDNLVVMCNAMKYWTKKYTRNHLDTVTKRVLFGVDNDSDELKRLFVTNEHIDLLNRGLKLIKPSYYTISELKKQRAFKVTKHDTKDHLVRAREKAEQEYKLYEKRFGWERVMRKSNYIADYIAENLRGLNEVPELEETYKEVEERAEQWAKDRYDCRKLTLEKFCDENLPRIARVGEYELCAE